MTLLVKHPLTYENERQYAYQVILKDFLGLDYRSVAEERRDILISVDDEESCELLVSDVLFQTPKDEWFKANSLPVQPLETFDLSQTPVDIACVSPIIPIIYGSKLDNGNYIDVQDSKIKLGLDIFGSAFFMLTRYEEVVKTNKDEHERFPAWASLAYHEGFLMRPIINEYVEILWWSMKKIWSNLERKKRSYKACLSHDVDQPLGLAGNGLLRALSLLRTLKHAADDVIKRKDVYLLMHRIKSFAQVCIGNVDEDVNNTFDFIMDMSERKGLKSAFYFMADHTSYRWDGIYSLDNLWIRNLMRKIYHRGHEIGLHTSYNSFCNPEQIKKEFQKLISVAEEEGVRQNAWGGRQHYLRWKVPTTWQAWEDAGLDYDSTLAFADHVGFRCGVCFEYPVYDILRREALNLHERPLIVMDGTVLEDQYMGLSHEKSLSLIQKLVETCKMFNGNFTLLWHNSSLLSKKDRELYGKVLMGI